VLLRADGAALLQHRDEKPGLSAPGQWVFPGGHCEGDESRAECARREFLEETGYNCSDLRPLTEVNHICSDTGRAIRLSFWWSRYDGVSPISCFEGQEVRFIPRAEGPKHPIPDYLPAVWDMALAEEKTALRPK
jgi:8-oxo-dGTP pyrophosphatase MutT (NUDIX family)